MLISNFIALFKFQNVIIEDFLSGDATIIISVEMLELLYQISVFVSVILLKIRLHGNWAYFLPFSMVEKKKRKRTKNLTIF